MNKFDTAGIPEGPITPSRIFTGGRGTTDSFRVRRRVREDRIAVTAREAGEPATVGRISTAGGTRPAFVSSSSRCAGPSPALERRGGVA